MIVFVYLGEHGNNSNTQGGKSKMQRAKIISIVSPLIISVNAFMYGICDSAKLYFKPEVKYIWDLGFVL